MRCSPHMSPIPQTGCTDRPRANHSHLYTSHLRPAILAPFSAPSLRNPHFATPRVLAPQSLRPFLRSLRNPHLLSFANRRIVSSSYPFSHKLATLRGR
ncbi:hypothetical protein BTHE_1276 [Bifidobacterium thermophilum]|nr:hypothetical protein BTHE_1276 [Bifidobacterium thermophilum]